MLQENWETRTDAHVRKGDLAGILVLKTVWPKFPCKTGRRDRRHRTGALRGQRCNDPCGDRWELH